MFQLISIYGAISHHAIAILVIHGDLELPEVKTAETHQLKAP
jgi:hypothetical protein